VTLRGYTARARKNFLESIGLENETCMRSSVVKFSKFALISCSGPHRNCTCTPVRSTEYVVTIFYILDSTCKPSVISIIGYPGVLELPESYLITFLIIRRKQHQAPTYNVSVFPMDIMYMCYIVFFVRNPTLYPTLL
jgi:hypothetical protein